MNNETELNTGIAVIHSNRLEQLRDLVTYWLQTHPLAPLENEIVLVQSAGMGQWLKQELAADSALGIAGAMEMQLPARFLWNLYRAVLGDAEIPDEQPLGEAVLLWRLYRLLPEWVQQSGCSSLQKFLHDDGDQRKRYQLAERLADLYDQYQVYRADWLTDWARGRDVLRSAEGIARDLPDDQRWQAQLWRNLQADAAMDSAAASSRADVHERFLALGDALDRRPAGLPRRVIVFGISSLPQQTLEALARLGRFSQIVLCIHNPCRHFWADIVEDKDLLKAERKRQARKPGMPALLSDAELHLYANPLLAAWGKQGRDYIRLLDHFDHTENYCDWGWPDNRIDLFEDYADVGKPSLLQQVQQAILDLEPLPESGVCSEIAADSSIAFHIAHSPQREVEILHDQLLERFQLAEQGGKRLSPRDVIVMVPDIDTYAAQIRAVFGQMGRDDPRYIPFSLADQRERGQNPMLVALEQLLNLPDARFSVSEVLALLEAPCLRERFAIREQDIPRLHLWIEGAGIRWGLNARQRTQGLDMPVSLEQNTWEFGLRRMLLGYALGAGAAFDGVQPYEEIGGLEAQLVGALAHLLETLERYWHSLRQDATPAQWQERLLALIEDFFDDSHDRDRKTRGRLLQSLEAWRSVCEQGGIVDEALPVTVVREAWLSALDEPGLTQRFLGGCVNFCTLMPMRAIPFRIVCVLGMNDGDYPRSHQPHSFDLMSNLHGGYRPGDRSRRQDDQYLFLEALLSAREQLYISWVGRSVRDNALRPPSVLVAQLRDYLRLGWRLPGAGNGQSLLERLTLEHPLQAFSGRYVARDRDSRLFTYAREWHRQEKQSPISVIPLPDGISDDSIDLSLTALARFLRYPVMSFCNESLKLWFDADHAVSEDNEPFDFDGLDCWMLGSGFLHSAQASQVDESAKEAFFAQQRTLLARKGQLPLGGFARLAHDAIAAPAWQSWLSASTAYREWPLAVDTQDIQLEFESSLADKTVRISLSGNLAGLRQDPNSGHYALIQLSPQPLFNKDQFKWRNLVRSWVLHLAACASGLPLQTLQIGSDQGVILSPIARDRAQDYLQILVHAWQQGMEKPLPVDCETAFAWLLAYEKNQDAAKADDAARKRYEGDEFTAGTLKFDPYLNRFYPDFSGLSRAGFADWTRALYEPMMQHVNADG
ncbi:exodeoxyribonuclease V subunit gamma [Candidatus Methylospira mobilis]|uniref:RecBCD enzyme subunit RecC n=1 Tax=Candidatus Methylospira mobilis TaxID=1808979 RepID=A0A5Q0BMU4_9GAMM|nr:exodeoxyribonuclease V subunit gamma [Candidatus Methylospira mobilis]QFY43534.1 exodeoxyribonuclease V subunit gamma [Candidatus Methylospira mobilis]WNV03925.1 exodeoxyribonuclease V subunit gamma [Candidatus Methylospira mobilis]